MLHLSIYQFISLMLQMSMPTTYKLISDKKSNLIKVKYVTTSLTIYYKKLKNKQMTKGVASNTTGCATLSIDIISICNIFVSPFSIYGKYDKLNDCTLSKICQNMSLVYFFIMFIGSPFAICKKYVHS